jgi:RNA polymerase sigma factor (sigma-70 family)
MLIGEEIEPLSETTLIERGPMTLEENLGLARKFVLTHFHLSCPVEDSDEYSLACEGLMRACKTYNEGIGEFSTYAYKCMRNILLSDIKRRKRRISPEFYDPSSFDLLTENKNRTLDDEAVSALIDEAMQFLIVSNKMDIEMLQDHYRKGMKLREIADKYSVTKMRVSQRINRAIEKIKTKLQEKI